MKLFRTAFPLFVLIAAFMESSVTTASAAESALDFRVAPAAGSQLSEAGDYFILDMEPGESRTQAIEISNPSQRSLRVQLAGVDAATAQMGGVDYGAEEVSARATGGWITLKDRSIPLAAGASTQARFEVEVPVDAVSGVNLGGIVIWVEGAGQETSAGAGTTMNVQSRRVIAVQVDVPGPASPLLEIRGAQAEARPDGLYLGIDLFNSGSGFAAGTGTVTIQGRDQPGTFTLDTMVPRTGTNFPFRWDSAAVPNGAYEVAIEVDYGEALATWQGQVSVGPALQADLRGRGVGEGAEPFSRSLVATGVALIALVMLLSFSRSRALLSKLCSRLPRVSVSRAPRQATPTRQATSHQRPRVVSRTPALFVPRSEEEQRRVPPPPPPPPPARPTSGAPAYAGAVGVSNFDY